MFCIQTGRVKLCRASRDGAVQLVGLVGPGQFLGHRELVTGHDCSYTAEVLAAGDICFIPRDTLLQELSSDPGVAHNVMRALANSLEQAESRLLEMACTRAEGRVARLLLQCSDEGKVDPLTREEMAQFCGLTVESVSRALRGMGRQGLLAFEGRRIHVLDQSALARK